MLTAAEIEKYLTRPEIVDAIASNDLEYVYNDLNITDRPALTHYLLDRDIDPLEYMTEIPEYFLRNASNKHLVIPNNITTIGTTAFAWCTSLTSIVIEDGVTTIGSGAFCGCSGLTSVVIPDSVTIIRDSAFSFCSRLRNVEIGNSVTTIGERAFYSCASLTSVVIPNSVTSLSEEAFSECSKLKEIIFNGSKKEAMKLGIGNHSITNWRQNSKIICTDGVIDLQ